MTDSTPQPGDESGYIDLVPDGKLKKRIIREGYGEPIHPESSVFVHYTGYIHPDGRIFDSSRDRGDEFQFSLGANQVIQGWEVGVASMLIGEEADILCSPEYAYGEHGYPPSIPPNATLRFNIELIKADARSYPDAPWADRIASAERAKEQGNLLVKQSHWDSAASIYRAGISKIENAWGADPPELKIVNELLIALNSNLALCYLKTKDCAEAVEACQKGLELAPRHTKLTYRLGQAYAGLSRFDEAIEALEEVATFDPSDTVIKNELERVKKAKQAAARKEKEMYSKMFGGK
ncbi:cytochrome P450 monooxygenase 9 [Rhizophlyctis rosea]|uniref:peptidylprolyl isomerase n=1 Tax=Rhizophlyctis rosea TaxID=64517 RepID=A0AAD5S6B2_9FUNG|nr:cytochrome P450 monooxygenase 9 [Rhizophlyctis rosea]